MGHASGADRYQVVSGVVTLRSGQPEGCDGGDYQAGIQALEIMPSTSILKPLESTCLISRSLAVVEPATDTLTTSTAFVLLPKNECLWQRGVRHCSELDQLKLPQTGRSLGS